MDEYTARLKPYCRHLETWEVDSLMRKSVEELSIGDIVSLCRNEYFVRTQEPKSFYQRWPYNAIYNYLVEKKKITGHQLHINNMGYR